ncbi:MAG: hypothetical protein HQK55_05130 [Deltaproteobacteria bacterium]|nr:hypothetical protein [Deltaproteobacteria bacterium]
MQDKVLADVWGDTVDLKHLALAMVIGVVISLTFYLLGLMYLQNSYPNLTKSLMTAYALLIGILGCLSSAVVSAKFFKPKRSLNEDHFSEKDRNAVLDELQIDREKEAEELKSVGPEIIAELKNLELYELFAGNNHQPDNDEDKVG